MQMNEAQRQELARRIAAVRLERFRGSRKAAYTLAGVNSATWARLENGESVKEASLVAALLALWPESGGDWQRLIPSLSSESAPRSVEELIEEVRGLRLPAKIEAEFIATIEAQREELGLAERGRTG